MTSSKHAPIGDDDLEARLRADASTWGGAPSRATLARITARGQRPRRRLLAAFAAAALVAAVAAWPRPRARETPAPAFDAAAIERLALAPLEEELEHLVRDGRTLAREVWQQVPPPLRRLLGG
jgi:hypothetical protein